MLRSTTLNPPKYGDDLCAESSSLPPGEGGQRTGTTWLRTRASAFSMTASFVDLIQGVGEPVAWAGGHSCIDAASGRGWLALASSLGPDFIDAKQ